MAAEEEVGEYQQQVDVVIHFLAASHSHQESSAEKSYEVYSLNQEYLEQQVRQVLQGQLEPLGLLEQWVLWEVLEVH